MKYADLYPGFVEKTTIQKKEHLIKLIGSEITIDACISDIQDSRIILIEIVNSLILSDGPKIIYGLNLHYNKEKFETLLLSYQYGTDVNIKAKLVDGSINKEGHPVFKFELVSISKIGTTLKTRQNADAKGGCFIATACYGNYDAPEVLILREFRDKVLLQTYFGKLLVSLYYSFSPFFAAHITKSERLKKIVKEYLIEPIVEQIARNK